VCDEDADWGTSRDQKMTGSVRGTWDATCAEYARRRENY
jgi:hypothetical protein